MGKIRMRSTSISDNPSLQSPVFHFSPYLADGEHTYYNNENVIDFVTDGNSLYVCLSHDGVTPTYENIEDNGDFLKIVSQGPQGIRGPRGHDGESAETPRLNAEFDNDQLRVYVNGELETVSPRLTGKAWRPKLEDNMIVWELSNRMYSPEPIDLEELRPTQEKPLLLRVDSDNTKRSDETSGPAGFIQWKYEGDAHWTNLISISELMNLTLAGVSIWKNDEGKWHFGHRKVIGATYESDKLGNRIISKVQLGDVLFDAGELPFEENSETRPDYGVDIDLIYTRLATIEEGMVKSVNGFGPDSDGNVNINIPTIPSLETYAQKGWVNSNFQPKGNYLTEHQHLKTINNQSLIGDGNITISAGGVSLFDVKIEGGHLWKTTDGQDWIDLGAINTGSGGNGISESEVKHLIGQILEGILDSAIPEYERAAGHNYFVRINELNSILSNYYTKSQVYSKGEIDQMLNGGEVATLRTFMIFKRSASNESETLPTTAITWNISEGILDIPSGSNGWKEHPDNASDSTPYLWVAYGTFESLHGSLVGSWDGPFCLTGENGKEGADGRGIEFIYHLGPMGVGGAKPTAPRIDYTKSKKESSTDTRTKEWWATNASADYCPGDYNNGYWTDNPQGIDDSQNSRVEWASIRKSHYDSTNKVTVWEDFCEPFIWAMWGEDGMDGDGVQYIFLATANPITVVQYPPIHLRDIYNDANGTDVSAEGNDNNIDYNHPKASYEYYDTGEFIPNGWTDDPSDVDAQQPYEYVSIRRYNGSTQHWGAYSIPKVWRMYKVEYHTSSDIINNYQPYTEFAFTRTSKNLTGYTVTGGQSYAHPLQGIVTKNAQNQVDNEIVWTDGVPANSTDQIWVITALIGDEEQQQTATWTGPWKLGDRAGIQIEYSNDAKAAAVYDDPSLWNNNNLTLNAFQGTDEQREASWEAAVLNDYGVWSDDVVDPIYMATCTLVGDVWSDWVIAKIKGERGPGGSKGTDGSNIEYVYYRTNGPRPMADITRGTYTRDVFDQNGERDDTVAKVPIIEGQLDLLRQDFFPAVTGLTSYPDGTYWHDNPAGVNETLTHEWIAMRMKPAGAVMWTDFNVALWSKFGEKGRDGDGVEYVFFPVTKEQHDIIKEHQFRLNNKLYVGKLPVSNNAIMNGQSFAQNGDPAEPEFLPYSQEIQSGVSPIRAQDDNPGGTNEKPYVYCSQRKFNGTSSSWGDFGPASLWVVLDTPEAIVCRTEIDNDTVSVLVDDNDVVQVSKVFRPTGNSESFLYRNQTAQRITSLSVNGVILATTNANGYVTTGESATITTNENGNSATITVTSKTGSVSSESNGFKFALTFEFGSGAVLHSPVSIPITFYSNDIEALGHVTILPTTETSTFKLAVTGGNRVIKTTYRGSKDYSTATKSWVVYYKTTDDLSNGGQLLDTIYPAQYWFGYDGNITNNFTPDSFLTAQDKADFRAQEVTLAESPSHVAFKRTFYFDKSGNKLRSEDATSLYMPSDAYFAFKIQQVDLTDDHEPWTKWFSEMVVNLEAFENDNSNYPIDYITLAGGGNNNIVDKEDILIIYNGDPVILQNTGAKLVSMNVGSEEITCTDDQNDTASLSVVRANAIAENIDEDLLNWYSYSTKVEDNYTLGQNEPGVISSSSVLGVTKEGDGFINVTKTGADDNLLKVNLNIDALVEELIHRFGGRPVVQGTSVESISSGNVSVNGGYVHQGEQITITGEPGSTIAGLYTDTSHATEITTLDANGQATGYVGNNNITITDSTGPSYIPTLNIGDVTPGVAPAPSVVAALYVSVPSNSNGEAQLTFNSISQDAAATVTYTLTFSRAVSVTSVEGSTSHSAITGDHQNTVTIINPDPREIWIDFSDFPEGTLMWVYATASVVYDNEEPTVYTSAKKYFKTTKRASITPSL